MKPEEIKALRESLGMTQQEFAKALGLATRSAACHLERGSKEPKGPLLVLLELLAGRRRAPRRAKEKKPK